MEKESIGEPGGRGELLVSIRRLSGVVLEKLEEGSAAKTLDAAQIRLLGGIAFRILRLWRQCLTDAAGKRKGEQGLETMREELGRALEGELRTGRRVRGHGREQAPGRAD